MTQFDGLDIATSTTRALLHEVDALRARMLVGSPIQRRAYKMRAAEVEREIARRNARATKAADQQASDERVAGLLRHQVAMLASRIALMQPVVDAALEWRKSHLKAELASAVDTYLESLK